MQINNTIDSDYRPLKRIETTDRAILLNIINQWQQVFPLTSRPFKEIADRHTVSEDYLIAYIQYIQNHGILGRLGAVFSPNRIGASTLAAISIPQRRITEVVQYLNSRSDINHNYEREHVYNIWFVITSDTPEQLTQAIESISKKLNVFILSLPLQYEFHINLGFSLTGAAKDNINKLPSSYIKHSLTQQPIVLTQPQKALVTALNKGLTICHQPYQLLAKQLQLPEHDIIHQIKLWQNDRTIRRLGFIIQHKAVGYQANAMCVWHIAPHQLVAVGQLLGCEEHIHLCYARYSPDIQHWPYNLFAMIHGKSRDEVLKYIDYINHKHKISNAPQAVLFSTQQFKQQGAGYFQNPSFSSTNNTSLHK